MTPEEELTAYREELKAMQKNDLRNARSTATKFGIAAVISLTALVYAFFEKTQANKARELAWLRQREFEQITEAGRRALVECRAGSELLRLELEKCKGK